jgi:aspartokinase-like uncharacterized kinase
MNHVPFHVVKVGGSLFDLPDLGKQLRWWLDQWETPRTLLIPGGGLAADTVRAFDRAQHLGEEAAHWLALEAMRLNVSLLLAVLPNSGRVADLDECEKCWEGGRTPILDVLPFMRLDERNSGRLPHSWQATSDSLAARLAEVWGAARLVLLKSTALPAGLDWIEAGRCGLVDPCFADVVRRGRLSVETLDFRQWAATANYTSKQ